VRYDRGGKAFYVVTSRERTRVITVIDIEETRC
jgi:hypothetical protein